MPVGKRPMATDDTDERYQVVLDEERYSGERRAFLVVVDDMEHAAGAAFVQHDDALAARLRAFADRYKGLAGGALVKQNDARVKLGLSRIDP